MKRARVKAAPLPDPGLAGRALVPREGTLRRYITEAADGTEITLTPYYQRLIARGVLLMVDAPRDDDITGRWQSTDRGWAYRAYPTRDDEDEP